MADGRDRVGEVYAEADNGCFAFCFSRGAGRELWGGEYAGGSGSSVPVLILGGGDLVARVALNSAIVSIASGAGSELYARGRCGNSFKPLCRRALVALSGLTGGVWSSPSRSSGMTSSLTETARLGAEVDDVPVVSLSTSSFSGFFFRKSTTRFFPFLFVRLWLGKLYVELWLNRDGRDEDVVALSEAESPREKIEDVSLLAPSVLCTLDRECAVKFVVP